MRRWVPSIVLAVFAVLVVLNAAHHGSTEAAPTFRAGWTLTPGVLNPDVTQANVRSTVCAHGWTKTIRPPVSYTNRLKLEQMRQYGLTGDASDYQEDHLVSLELGGHPTDPRNLWPEPYPRASEVDQIENQLNAEVCSGSLSLRDAQEQESALKHTQG